MPKTNIPPECEIDAVVTGDGPIKRGTFRVFQGKWCGSDVLIKCCHSTASADARQRFYKECLFVRGDVRQSHPHIVQYFGVCKTSGGIVSEYMECTLKERLQSGQPPLTRLAEARIARGVAAGLEHLHSRDLVYRNVCTRGIMLTSVSATDCTAKLSDLMLACKEKTHSTSASGAQGLIAYAHNMIAANTRAHNLGTSPKNNHKTSAAATTDRSTGGAGNILDYLELYYLQAPEMREQIAQAKRRSGGDGSDDTASILAERSHDLHSLGVTLLAMCTRTEPDGRQLWRGEAMQRVEDEDSNVKHPLLLTMRALLQDEPERRESACAVGRRLSAVVDTLLLKCTLIAPNGRQQDQRQDRSPELQVKSLRRDLSNQQSQLKTANEELHALREKYCTLTEQLEGQELATAQELAKVARERDQERERARKLAGENEDRKGWLETGAKRNERQQAELEELRRARLEERDADRRTAARNDNERRLLLRTVERMACRVRQTRVGPDRAAACCLVLGMPPEGDGDIAVAPQWSQRLDGRELCFEEDVVCISRHPCAHNGRIYTAVWRKHQRNYVVSFCSAAPTDLNNWKQETQPFILDSGSTPKSDPFDFVSYDGTLFCISASERARTVRLSTWKPPTLPEEHGKWEEVAVKRGSSVRFSYAIGLVGGELLLIGGTARAAERSAAVHDVLAFNLQRQGGGGGAEASRWPALPEGTRCTNASVIATASHIHLHNGVHGAGNRLQSTVLSLELSASREERRWQRVDGFIDAAGCGVGASGDYTVVAGIHQPSVPAQAALVAMVLVGAHIPAALLLSRIKLHGHGVKVRAAQERMWLDLPDLNLARSGCSLLAVDGQLVCLGGSGDRGPFVKQIEVLSWP